MHSHYSVGHTEMEIQKTHIMDEVRDQLQNCKDA